MIASSDDDTIAAICAAFKFASRGAVMSTIILTAPIIFPSRSNTGVGYGLNHTSLPSGRTAIAVPPRWGRCSLSAIAMGH